MLYCSNCGKRIDEKKIESKNNSLVMQSNAINEETKVVYICPRCEHHIHHNLDEKEIKQLSRAAHAEIQRSNNFFSSGMGNVCIGAIALVLAVIFYYLSCDLNNQMKLDMSSAEFYVFLVLTIVGGLLLVAGVVLALVGLIKKARYNNLLKDINNKTFIQ